MLISDLIAAMECIAPPNLAESWDNVGLILGDRSAALRGPVVLTIDLDAAVLREAVEHNAGAIVAYHPPIFSGIKRLTTDSAHGEVLLEAAERKIAVYSPHTALDAAPGGVCDWLLGLAGVVTWREALVPAAVSSAAFPKTQVKLVTFVPTQPADVLERVRSALARAGAGRIGHYDECSFSITGTGTFHGDDASNPSVGSRGRLESVSEHRLEMVLEASALPGAIAALRGAHPYEEPAFDVYPLQPLPPARADWGAGRVGTLAAATTARAIAQRLKAALPGTTMLASREPERPVTRVAVCPGSGASLLEAAAGAGAQVFITGEMKHHEVLAALDEGVSVIACGHTETERGYLPTLAARLGSELAGVKVMVSRADGPPLRAV